MYIYIQSKRALFCDSIEHMTSQNRNENILVYPFYLNTITINSAVKNLVERCEYVNIKHIKDGGCMKMETY
jgi:hypothetical protein